MFAKAIRPFLPSRDFQRSKTFYTELGFKITYEEETLVILTAGAASFFLQPNYLKEWAENTMVQLFVDDLEGLYDRAMILAKAYPEIIVKPIYVAHYGKTFHLIGPEGVLWHMMSASK